MVEFSLHPALDPQDLARRYAADGWVTVDPFLGEGQAEALHENIRTRQDWRWTATTQGNQVVDLDRETRASLSPEQRSALDQACYAQARTGFQLRYETLRVPDDEAGRAASDDLLARFATFLSSGETRDTLRTIIGDPRIRYADCQATAYAPGDFLTGHDDDIEGKERSAAYVLGLNPRWDIEWGGLFLMHEDGGRRAEALVPGFNVLNLFAVPRQHSVTEVTRVSPYRRYSITGWLRR